MCTELIDKVARHRGRGWLLIALGMFAVIFVSMTPEAAKATATEIMLVDQQEIRPRLIELTLRTNALSPTDTKVRVLLPEGYSESKKRHYPVIYLYHGGLGNHTRYTATPGNPTETLTADLPVIVVMPDGGIVGYYTNWYNNGAFGPPEWDTYHIDQLIPWIDANFRTIPRRSARATVGFSMGGHGSLAYATRHPDVIGAVASLSGAIDINSPNLGIRAPAQQGLAAQIFGSYATEEVRWRGHNPLDLAANLVNTDVSLYVGDTGTPESSLNVDAHAVHERLNTLGIAHRFTVNPGFRHDDANYAKSFADWLPHVMEYFAGTTRCKGFIKDSPKTVTYASIEDSYSVHDWTVTIERAAVEFSALEIGNAQFSVVGSGAAKVVTLPRGRPFERYRVKIEGFSGISYREVRADRQGRLSFSLDLGPANPFQQYTAAADQASTAPTTDELPFYTRGNGSRFFRTTVAFLKSLHDCRRDEHHGHDDDRRRDDDRCRR